MHDLQYKVVYRTVRIARTSQTVLLKHKLIVEVSYESFSA